MTLGGRCTNADFKGYRADVAARVGGSVRLDKGQGNFWGIHRFWRSRPGHRFPTQYRLFCRKQPGRSKPPGFKAMQLLFDFFAPQQHKQDGRAQRQHQQKRGPGGIAGLRNTECGCGGLRRGRGGRRFTDRRLRAYRRGNCAGLQRGQQTVVLKLQHKGRKQGQGKRVFSWVISPILYNRLLNSLYRCVLLYIRHGHNIGPVHGAAVLQRGRCDARPPRPLLR